MREAVEKTAKGVAIEQARLFGSAFLVVSRIYELDYDGISETVRIEAGCIDLDDAVTKACVIGAERVVEEATKHAGDNPLWSRDQARNHWPKVKPTFAGHPIPVFCERLSDHTGFNAVEISVAVIPTVPDNPINIEVVNAIGLMFELVRWFAEVQAKTPDRS